MQPVELNRTKVICSAIVLLVFLLGAWGVLSIDVFHTINDILQKNSIVDINVYALWVPVGFLGAIGYFIVAFSIAIITGKRTDTVWGERGQRLTVKIVGLFAVLGLVSAFATYQWMTGELEKNGYVFSKENSRFSAFGRHEVYLKTKPLM